MSLGSHLEQSVPAAPELDYDRASGYRFAQRYAGGKTVANVGWEDTGYGSYLLAETAESVIGLANSPEAIDLASAAYPMTNVTYQRVSLPKLPYSEACFDVVVAFGVIDKLYHPEALLEEAKRVLKQDGVLLISMPAKGSYAGDHNSRRQGMYVPEFQDLLERHFEHVHLYRQGAVAGSLVFPASGKVTGALVESAQLSRTRPYLGVEPPVTRFVIAVCSNVEAPRREDKEPYLLLDRDRRIYEEYKDRVEDVELLQEEIQRMQETEVQAFQDALKVHRSEMAYLRAQLDQREAQARSLRNRLYDMENSTVWRLSGPYRWLRTAISELMKPKDPKGDDGL